MNAGLCNDGKIIPGIIEHGAVLELFLTCSLLPWWADLMNCVCVWWEKQRSAAQAVPSAALLLHPAARQQNMLFFLHSTILVTHCKQHMEDFSVFPGGDGPGTSCSASISGDAWQSTFAHAKLPMGISPYGNGSRQKWAAVREASSPAASLPRCLALLRLGCSLHQTWSSHGHAWAYPDQQVDCHAL